MSDYSGHNIEDDYFTLRGIELRTGIKQEDLVNALLGEILDNGIDDQETHNVKTPYMNIIVSKEKCECRNLTFSNILEDIST